MAGAGAVPAGVLLLESVNRLRVAEMMLQNRARSQVGLTANELQALQYVAAAAAAGVPAHPRQIAETLGVTGAAVSMLLDRLVKRGLVHRQRDPEDGRSRVLYLTSQARAALGAVYGELPDAVLELLDAVPTEEARRIAALAAAVQNVLDSTAPMTR
ncbi:MarR family transcriptional regulator [Curtobacterium sp. PhB142]|nr:MarR family transcriptional regulator [Curtobacterium sp. PhB142]TCL98406.1 MarR family transcriptional regulator [Curtobacterium sp. PhB134]